MEVTTAISSARDDFYIAAEDDNRHYMQAYVSYVRSCCDILCFHGIYMHIDFTATLKIYSL